VVATDSLEEHVFVCRGYSKTLGAQSWRLGYAVSHPETIKSLMTHHDPIYIRFVTHSLSLSLLQSASVCTVANLLSL
jgi:histidinol-phosphate/aromatic aminotransferase/cobyric acid decarboxylase-like protein